MAWGADERQLDPLDGVELVETQPPDDVAA